MLPRTLCLLSTRAEGDLIFPRYLSERDHPWLRVLLDEHARFVGKHRSELRERLAEPLPVRAPKFKLRIAALVLDRVTRDRTTAPVVPREARFRLFRAAASAGDVPRERLVEEVAGELGVTPSELDEALFADLPGERRVSALPEDFSPARLAHAANFAIISGFFRRSARLLIRAWGNTRPLVRQARFAGLICLIERAPNVPFGGCDDASTKRYGELDVERDDPGRGICGRRPSGGLPDGVVLSVSGPFTLFRRTELYGRALSSLLPRIAWCHSFEIVAECALGRGDALSRVVIRDGDPIEPGRELERYDSRLEERFAREFAREAPDWDSVREPSPIDANGALIFPDFELVHRRDSQRRWFLEIVGFWTPSYFEQKLRHLRAANLDRFILCVDESKRCSDGELPEHAHIVRFRKRVDPAAVVAIIERG